MVDFRLLYSFTIGNVSTAGRYDSERTTNFSLKWLRISNHQTLKKLEKKPLKSTISSKHYLYKSSSHSHTYVALHLNIRSNVIKRFNYIFISCGQCKQCHCLLLFCTVHSNINQQHDNALQNILLQKLII